MRVKYHSFRASFVSFVLRAGYSTSVAQDIRHTMPHQTPRGVVSRAARLLPPQGPPATGNHTLPYDFVVIRCEKTPTPEDGESPLGWAS